ncbi:1,4-dihydroxy-2-naphthoate octaprenyltransferase [Belliella buryatensis]|uniref:1,4-dihydroxy-2-naphthoate octaprenyltransferase n=1 Tax=Belliella buryatensis TaxID=1500549 RepID=A0A239BSX3_9BACT|nr:UbiA family prenyltransferase [Belliella buryatensis]SNS10154.1 1,4-dihydroxy-2-naphthoate octaprenyltransferase [Belliella buryatensis]
MFSLSSWKHLRIPFSFYLLPIFILALAFTPNHNPERMLLVFLSLHLFLYPSSNGYNSYFDKDEGSIGGLKNPPKVNKGLYYLSLVFFLIAIVLAALINPSFAGMVIVYGLVSMAYSHPSIRLKKMPYVSWIVAGFFQGCFTFCMAYAGLSDFGFEVLTRPHVVIPGLLTSLMLWGSYPLTQIYQHEEDAKRGDQTLSLKLGIKGTFLFSSIWFFVAGIAFAWFFVEKNQIWALYGFMAAMSPVILYFLVWFSFVTKNSKKYVTYSWAMWMNRISAIALNIFFFWYFLENTQILQVM